MLTLAKAALTLDEDIYLEFKAALARGFWGSGIPLTEAQKRTCHEVIAIREEAHSRFSQQSDGSQRHRSQALH